MGGVPTPILRFSELCTAAFPFPPSSDHSSEQAEQAERVGWVYREMQGQFGENRGFGER